MWDLPTRVLHWTNAALLLVLLALGLGFEAFESMGWNEDALERFHATVGHVFVVTFILRIIWGFTGNRYARFSDIIPWTGEAWKKIAANVRWVLGGMKGDPPVSVGHNPLASLFYIAVFVVLIGQSYTGVMLAGEEFDMFPGRVLASAEVTDVQVVSTAWADEDYGYEDEEHGHGAEGFEGGESASHEAYEEFHEFGMWFIIFYLAAHLTGLILHEVGEKRGLLRSMFTGKKVFRKDELKGIIEK